MFLSMEASIACNPITSFHALRQSESEKARFKNQNVTASKNQMADAKIFTTNISERKIATCVFCKKPGHGIHNCYKLSEKPVTERVRFIPSERLCFGCLSPGHQSKSCSNQLVCDTCSKRHPTCLHEERSKREQELKKEQPKEKVHAKEITQSQDVTKETTSNRVVQDGNSTQTSAIVPVYVSTPSDPSREVLVYAYFRFTE